MSRNRPTAERPCTSAPTARPLLAAAAGSRHVPPITPARSPRTPPRPANRSGRIRLRRPGGRPRLDLRPRPGPASPWKTRSRMWKPPTWKTCPTPRPTPSARSADFCEEGYDVVIATSFGYGPAVLAVAPQFPDIQFIHISGYQTAENVSTGFGKIEEPQYVTGVVAAPHGGNRQARLCRGVPHSRGDPRHQRLRPRRPLGQSRGHRPGRLDQYLVRSAAGEAAAQTLVDLGIEVIATNQDSPAPQQTAEAAGIYSIAYNVDMSELAPAAVLTSAVWDWGSVLHLGGRADDGRNLDDQRILGIVGRRGGRSRPGRRLCAGGGPHRGGGAVPKSSAAARAAYRTSSPARSRTRMVRRRRRRASLSDEEILHMDWFVEGVSGSATG